MISNRQVLIWGAGFAVLVLMIWILKGILLPFLAAAAIAYFLDPVADWLERRRLPRVVGVLLITFVFFALVVAAGIFLVPLIVEQAMALTAAMPRIGEQLRALAAELRNGNLGMLLSTDTGIVGEAIAEAKKAIAGAADGFIGRVVSSSLGLINLIGLLTITPVVAFYLLLDWDHIIARIDLYVPRRHSRTVRQLAKEIDRVISGYARGTATVCVILAIFYGTALSLVGLDYGLTVGIVSGLLSFVPFVGAAVGFAASGLLAAAQFWNEPVWIGVVLGIFILGQVIEGNFLTPRLVGQNVGLHPLWVIFGLLAFGAIFGFVGVLLAVPAAATLGVLVRHALSEYLASPLYSGGLKEGGPPPWIVEAAARAQAAKVAETQVSTSAPAPAQAISQAADEAAP